MSILFFVLFVQRYQKTCSCAPSFYFMLFFIRWACWKVNRDLLLRFLVWNSRVGVYILFSYGSACRCIFEFLFFDRHIGKYRQRFIRMFPCLGPGCQCLSLIFKRIGSSMRVCRILRNQFLVATLQPRNSNIILKRKLGHRTAFKVTKFDAAAGSGGRTVFFFCQTATHKA